MNGRELSRNARNNLDRLDSEAMFSWLLKQGIGKDAAGRAAASPDRLEVAALYSRLLAMGMEEDEAAREVAIFWSFTPSVVRRWAYTYEGVGDCLAHQRAEEVIRGAVMSLIWQIPRWDNLPECEKEYIQELWEMMRKVLPEDLA